MADFEMSAGKLVVNRNLYDDFENEFERLTKEFVDSPQDDLLLDMSAVDYMRSFHLSIVVSLHSDALDKGKTLQVIISPKLEELFTLFGLDQLLNIQVAQ